VYRSACALSGKERSAPSKPVNLIKLLLLSLDLIKLKASGVSWSLVLGVRFCDVTT